MLTQQHIESKQKISVYIEKLLEKDSFICQGQPNGQAPKGQPAAEQTSLEAETKCSKTPKERIEQWVRKTKCWKTKCRKTKTV